MANGSASRKTFNLPPALTGLFAEIQDRTGASSDTEVMKNALRLYIYLFQNMKDTDALIIKKADGSETNIGIFI